MEFNKVLVQLSFAISKRELDILYNKLYVRVASWAAERLRVLGNMAILGKPPAWGHSLVSSLPTEQKQAFGTGAQKIRKTRYQSFLALSKFAWSLNFSYNILERIVLNPFKVNISIM